MDIASILLVIALLIAFWGTLRKLGKSGENLAEGFCNLTEGVNEASKVAPVIGRMTAQKYELELQAEIDEIKRNLEVANSKPRATTKSKDTL